MAERFKFEKKNWYPHMKPADVLIWEKFIDKNPDYYDECEYDVPVGPGAPADPRVNEETEGDINALYQKKIDVVGFGDKQIDVVEVKPNAGSSAVGQVKYYKKLYLEDFKPRDEVFAVIVTNAVRPGMAEFCKAEGVVLLVV